MSKEEVLLMILLACVGVADDCITWYPGSYVMHRLFF